MTHLTFDYAQQIELPFHTRQVGPLYFQSRFKFQVFGVCNEAARQQRNYLFHEGQCIGQDGRKSHGPNSVLSILNDYIANSGQLGDSIYLHANNCVGQIKKQVRNCLPALAYADGLLNRHPPVIHGCGPYAVHC